MTRVECVPNFSEGRRPEVVGAIVERIASVPGVAVLDHGMDADHHRAVVTFVGPAAAVGEAAFRAIAEATRRIDLRSHRGVHPRMGATDVCPFVPLGDATLEDCARLAREVGERVGVELALPVYYYGAAALRPERARLPDVRRGGFEALRDAIGRDPAREPDAGPRDAIHPTAGAVAIGARPFLIAFNVNLETRDVAVAKEIAAMIRESSGGLPGIRALGLRLEGPGLSQVSMNVCDYRATGLDRVFEVIEREAARRGVAIRESELVGLAPSDALDAALARRLRLRRFDPARQLIEVGP